MKYTMHNLVEFEMDIEFSMIAWEPTELDGKIDIELK